MRGQIVDLSLTRADLGAARADLGPQATVMQDYVFIGNLEQTEIEFVGDMSAATILKGEL
jgi:hypothetical protein